jgi:hypothetical protein
MALYQLKMHRLEREGHRPKQGEGGQDLGEKNQNHSFTLKGGGKSRKAGKRMKFKRPEK